MKKCEKDSGKVPIIIILFLIIITGNLSYLTIIFDVPSVQ